jgi:hypothetical protein
MLLGQNLRISLFLGCTLEVYCVVFQNAQECYRTSQYFSLFAEAEIRKTRGKATEEDS